MTTPARVRSWRALGAVVLASLTLAAASLTAAPASAHARHDSHHDGKGQHDRHGYLALGDSVAFGFTPPQTTPPADYLDAPNFAGYPEVLAARRGLHLTNASCPGETTDSMIDENAQSNGCENSVGSPVGYRDTFPLHVAYAGSQLDFAVHYLRTHPRTRLVSLDIGANDVFICQTTKNGCAGADFAAVTQRVQRNVDTILSTLRQRAHYHHRLVVLSYYSLDYGDPVGTGGIAALNAALSSAAAANRTIVADGFGVFRAATAPFGGDTCAADLIIALPGGGCNVHPTPAGHELLADAVGAVAGHGSRRH